MRKFLLAGILLSGMVATAQKQQKQIKKYAEIISATALKQQLSIIASAEMEGRETASEGQRKAAAYIESQMKAIGLAPGNGSDYQMHFPVFQDSIISTSFTLNGIPLAWNKDFTAKNDNYNYEITFGEVLFVNFEDSAWKNDKIDVSGKLVMVNYNLPANRSERFALLGKIASLGKKGAATVFLVEKSDTLSTVAAQNATMRISKFPASHLPNVFNITPGIAEKITGSRLLDSSSSKTFTCEIELAFKAAKVQKTSSNVLGILPGNGSTDEWLLITAHYDHLGKKDTVIWYGADDDGSGTAAVITLARAFAKAKADGVSFPRNILFMTVSGEEKGLLGSKYFSDHPSIPLDKVTADLNIDMIGRSDTIYDKKIEKNYLYVVGDDKLSSELTPVSREANKTYNLILDAKYNDPKDRQRIYYRSDHYNFAKKGVPVMFYYDGGNPDYHRPTDTVDRIEFDLMALRAKYIFTTAWLIANRPQMLKRDLDRSEVGER